MKLQIKLKFLVGSALLSLATFISASTLDSVRNYGFLKCGVSTGLSGFSSVDSKGKWYGIDVDLCRAVAAAVLGDSNKVKFIGLTAKERFTALQSGEIDILSRNTTWTYTRDTSLGLLFAGINYYDGQGFLVKKNLGFSDVKELDGATFCLKTGTTTELNIADYFRANNLKYNILPSESEAQVKNNFEAGRCDALTSDQSGLYAIRTTLKKPSSAIVLPNIISKEPLGPSVRQGDPKWLNIVKWTLNAMISAEELGVNSKNLRQTFNNPEINRLLGHSSNFHTFLGLDKNWSINIIEQVGNYAESFERNVGENTPLGIKRGLNALWRDGGILYSPPFR